MNTDFATLMSQLFHTGQFGHINIDCPFLQGNKIHPDRFVPVAELRHIAYNAHIAH